MKGTKILVIEDELFLRENLCELLELYDFQVKSAKNGTEGVELAKSYLPDLIICDVLMPVMTGFEVLKLLKSFPQFSQTPFIFLTARADNVDIRAGLGMGADDYIIKPFKKDELLKAVNTRLQEKRNG